MFHFYPKLALMSLLFLLIHISLPSSCVLIEESWFTLRCGVAGWIDDHDMFERLIEEERGRLRLREAAIRLAAQRDREPDDRFINTMSMDAEDPSVANLNLFHHRRD